MQRERSAPTRARVESTRTRALSTLSACTLLAGCLVTNELDFDPNRNAPSVTMLSPEPVTQVTSTGDPDCRDVLGGTMGLEFRAAYYDLDVEQTLYVRPFVNGAAYGLTLLADPNPDGSPLHLLPRIFCIDTNALNRACNRVQLFVYDNPRTLLNPDSSDEPPVSVEWFVIGPAADSPSGAGKPEAQPSDCLGKDGGL